LGFLFLFNIGCSRYKVGPAGRIEYGFQLETIMIAELFLPPPVNDSEAETLHLLLEIMRSPARHFAFYLYE